MGQALTDQLPGPPSASPSPTPPKPSRWPWIVGIVAAITCLGASCTGSTGEAAPTQTETTGPVTPTAAPSPSPEPPEKPKNPGLASLLGTYRIKYSIVHSTISNPATHEVQTWTTTPNCANGPCNTLIESSKDWKARATYLKGHYRWSRTLKKLYYCEIGSTKTGIDATGEYAIRPTAMRLVDNTWVVTRFTGSAEFRGHKSGGCIPLPEERLIIQGRMRVAGDTA
jgi:hypothetical protein